MKRAFKYIQRCFRCFSQSYDNCPSCFVFQWFDKQELVEKLVKALHPENSHEVSRENLFALSVHTPKHMY